METENRNTLEQYLIYKSFDKYINFNFVVEGVFDKLKNYNENLINNFKTK